jgi:mannitol-specific phosphotransferase system IIBC component
MAAAHVVVVYSDYASIILAVVLELGIAAAMILVVLLGANLVAPMSPAAIVTLGKADLLSTVATTTCFLGMSAAVSAAFVGFHIVSSVILSATLAAALALFGKGRRHDRQRSRAGSKHPF